jgi:hypothetical protein
MRVSDNATRSNDDDWVVQRYALHFRLIL